MDCAEWRRLHLQALAAEQRLAKEALRGAAEPLRAAVERGGRIKPGRQPKEQQ